jgi:N-acetylglucosaminyldiphosphoundecaprenol N-acetyl-beta-D-mannosaminyltransferase
MESRPVDNQRVRGTMIKTTDVIAPDECPDDEAGSVCLVAGVPMRVTDYEQATRQVVVWARDEQSRSVYAVSAHGVVEANDHTDFMDILRRADLNVPDGMPLVWMMRLKGYRRQQRVYGPTLMLRVLAAAAEEGIPVGFLGGQPEVLEALTTRMRDRFPDLRIVYAFSPPFRPLTTEEDEQVAVSIRLAGARLLFVGLGCPKQERWIHARRGRIPAVMLGVGAAFDFHAGVKRQAPGWMQRAGLEWLFRLFQEPRRLLKRYLYVNPRFILLALGDLLGKR